jgi:uncharacterized membrane protein
MSAYLHDLLGGTLLFHGISRNAAYLVLIGAAVALGVAGWMQVGKANRWVKRGAAFLRLTAIALLVLVLMEPVVRSEELLPQQSYLVHLFDASASMGIADFGGKTRAATTAETAAQNEELDRVYRRLEFTFDDALHAISDDTEWTAGEGATNPASALESAVSRTAGLPVTGIVLYTDGNPTAGPRTDEIVAAAEKSGVPVYTVGTAPSQHPPDAWLQEIVHPAEAAEGALTKVTVLVGARGMKGRILTASISDAKHEIDRQRIRPTSDDQVLAIEFDVRPEGSETAYYDCVVTHSAEEAYPWNNARDFFMNINPGKRRVLYVEGSPRYEYRFLRAAFADDERFQVTSLVLVTRDGELYRQGLRHAAQHRDGFPRTEEELFEYDVVIVGDVSASEFHPDSLAALREFVRKRGGGLLFLGGERSFAKRGFGRSPLAEVLPFDLESDSPLRVSEAYPVVPTQLGIENAVFGPNVPPGRANAWDGLPALTGLYALSGLKPGAVALCEAHTGRGSNPPLVAYQRFGRGVSLVCGVSATWPWKFHLPSEDPRYGAFWKSMILVLNVGNRGRLDLAAEPRQAAPGAEIMLSGAVLRPDFELDRAARVELTIERPDGRTVQAPAQALLAEGQTYSHTFTPDAPGVYRITARSLPADTREPLERTAIVAIRETAPEFDAIDLNEPLLRRIAEATGGAYVHLDDLGELPDRIKPREDALRIPHDEPLWDHPFIFAIVLGALVGEWFLRRAGGLA